MNTQTLLPGTVWHDPKSQRVVIIQNIDYLYDVPTVTYRNIGTETVYENSVEGFLQVFSCQKHSQK
jgi:multisubunit Na+/H+ antiporter MnhE subunit